MPLIRDRHQCLRLLEICAEELGDPLFGLRFGTRYDPRHGGVVGNVALASRTVRGALQTIGRYLPTMVDSAVYGLDVEGGTAFGQAPRDYRNARVNAPTRNAVAETCVGSWRG
jgi:hypothetical protein